MLPLFILSYEKVYFDKKGNLSSVVVYNTEDIISIKVDFTDIDYKANLKEEDFDVDQLVDENCCSGRFNTEQTASLDDVIYPLSSLVKSVTSLSFKSFTIVFKIYD